MINCQCSSFYHLTLTNRRYEVHKGLIFSGRYLLRNDDRDREYTEICSKFMDESMKNFLVRIGVSALCAIVVTLGPSYVFFIQHVRTTGLDVRVPFTDEKSYEEFVVSLIFQGMIRSGCVSGNRGRNGNFCWSCGHHTATGSLRVL